MLSLSVRIGVEGKALMVTEVITPNVDPPPFSIVSIVLILERINGWGIWDRGSGKVE